MVLELGNCSPVTLWVDLKKSMCSGLGILLTTAPCLLISKSEPGMY